MGLNKYLLNTTYILQVSSFGFLYFFPLPPTSKQNKTKSKKKKKSNPNITYNPACHLHIPFPHDYHVFKMHAILCQVSMNQILDLNNQSN